MPQNYSDIVWKGAGAPTEAQWNTFVSTTGLDKYRGQVAPRNALNEGRQYSTNDLRSRYQLKWGARLSF